ncbi:monothiol glutaredoxin [Nematocida sp. AWRm80]|nr:monothiol glutaredoxin [Nematocida sp. AWRm80]
MLGNKVIIVHNGQIDLPEDLPSSFVSLDVHENTRIEEELKKKYNITKIPCILCYDEVLDINDISTAIEKMHQREKKEFQEAIQEIKDKKTVLFIKGTPTRPQCRFTKQLLLLLEEEGITPNQYKSYNVLDNNTIRTEMKIFSDWPTFPQVYVKGQFIGGLDVLLQEKEKGKLSKILSLS